MDEKRIEFSNKISSNNQNKLVLPELILSREDYRQMSSENKRFYLENLILKILKLNRDKDEGITQQVITTQIDFVSDKTVIKTLNKLVESREIYFDTRHPKRYYINGRISHDVPGGKFELPNGQIFSLKIIANELGELSSPKIYLQESKCDAFGKIEKKGGIMIDGENFDIFIQSLVNFVPEISDFIENFRKKILEVID